MNNVVVVIILYSLLVKELHVFFFVSRVMNFNI